MRFEVETVRRELGNAGGRALIWVTLALVAFVPWGTLYAQEDPDAATPAPETPAAADRTTPADESSVELDEEPRRGGDWFRLRPTELVLELEGSYERRRVRSHRDDRYDTIQRNRDRRFEESVRLRMDGDIGGEDVLLFNTSLTLGLVQEDAREEIGAFTRHDSDNGELLEYDVSLDLFPESPLSFHADARHVRDRVPRRFLPSLLEERKEGRIAAFFTSGSWSSEVGFEASDVRRSGSRGNEDDEELEHRRFYIDSRWAISKQQNLRLSYDHEQDESIYQGSAFRFDTRRDRLRLDHDVAFGTGGRHRLDTFLRYEDERGDLAREELEFGPRLTLRHSDAFQTTYRYAYYRLKQDAIDLDRHKADIGAVWRPDQKWRLAIDGYALRERVDEDIETYEFGGAFDGTYRRPTEYGEFSANFALYADQRRTVGDAGERVVTGEAHILDSVRPAYLREADVDRVSIRAYNAQRNIVWIEGRDYRIVSVGRITSLYRILSGRIAEDEPVYFDYRYRIPAGSRVDTYRTDLRLEHEFTSGWTPYYAFEVRRQDAHGSRGAQVYADNTERHRLGVRYERPTWSTGAELDWFDDSVEPYDAAYWDARASLATTRDYALDTGARVAYFDYSGDAARRVWFVDLDLNQEVTIDPYWSARLRTAYRWEDNSQDGETDGVDVECGVRYRRGYLDVELTVEYDLLAIREDRDEGVGVWLYVRRDLSHLFRRRGTARTAQR